MASPYLILVFLLAISFTLATQLGLWREQSDRDKNRGASVLEALMGDSQRLFANHFFTKADVYLHSGVYPSIFDQAQRSEKSHLSQAAESTSREKPEERTPDGHADPHDHGDEHEHAHEQADAASGFLGKPRDCLDAFGRHFFPTSHVHLEKGEQREMLPWLELAAELNPNQVETYTVAAYWLRSRMGKVEEAEQFLREGWRANPDSAEILFELARLNEENHHDDFRARNLYELALRKWQHTEAGKPDPDKFVLMEITGRLARLEERAGHLDKAIAYLEMLASVSANPAGVKQQIEELKAKRAAR